MATDLTPLVALLTDPERLSEWRKCVLAVDGVRVTAAPVRIRRGLAVTVTQTRGRRHESETVGVEEWPARAAALLDAAERVHVLTAEADWHARRTRRGRWLVSQGKASATRGSEPPPHDRPRVHPLAPDDPDAQRLLVATGLFSPEGRLRKPQAAKYRQVQHYLELLRPLPVWRQDRRIRVVDAACGKAYMSLALQAWARSRDLDLDLEGVDSNPDVIASVARIADELGYQARFETATIWNHARRHEGEGVDLLVSLHACDTATDEALAAGVVLGAEAIVLAPCCHHELAGQLERSDGWSSAVLRHGLLRGRLADLLTDSLRATALEVFGYRADVIEFVAAEHTTKNLMIRAVRRPAGSAADRSRREAVAMFEALTERWGVQPALRRLLDDRWPSARTSA